MVAHRASAERLILGLNTDHAGASAALVDSRGIIAAIAEERLNRQKHSAAFPLSAVREVLRIGGVELPDITDLAVARNPQANLMRKISFVVRRPLHGAKLVLNRLSVHGKVLRRDGRGLAAELGTSLSKEIKLHLVEHHKAHIASAYYWSPFDSCAGLSIDGVGDFATSMWASCRDDEFEVLFRSFWPHSLGVFYTAICQFMGFDRYGEEYKVMGLAAYGENQYRDLMRRMVGFDRQQGLWLDLSYFQHQRTRSLFQNMRHGIVQLPQLWGDKLIMELGPPRERNQELTHRERNLAASMQARYEEVFLDIVRAVVDKTGNRRIVLAGGSVLNSVANGRMITEGYVDQAYFQPAAGDDGTAVGAACYVLHNLYKVPRNGPVEHAYWGTEWTEKEIEAALRSNARSFKRYSRAELLEIAADAIGQGKVVGWFQGREEWGPRALGNRSILCNPAIPDMKRILNSRIKNRESFRPFAPAIREEDLPECFEGTHPVPFMIAVYRVRNQWRKRLPAITHEDDTGRVQTVKREQNPLFYDLITCFKEKTGIPTVLNTSFNENEPIVHSPEQAIDCFERTKMDCLGIGPFWLSKDLSA